MNYMKAAAAVVATILSAVVVALQLDGSVSVSDWINVAILAAGSASVFAAPNVPGAAYTKTILAVITAVLSLAVSMVTNGLDTTEILQLILAAAGAVGVYALPNTEPATGDHAV